VAPNGTLPQAWSITRASAHSQSGAARWLDGPTNIGSTKRTAPRRPLRAALRHREQVVDVIGAEGNLSASVKTGVQNEQIIEIRRPPGRRDQVSTSAPSRVPNPAAAGILAGGGVPGEIRARVVTTGLMG
jgi:hypothetical protein